MTAQKRSSDVQLLKWVKHGSTRARAIYSLDVQMQHGAERRRFATAGADEKVRIWKMPPNGGEAGGQGGKFLLSTVHEHCGPVNCVRWGRGGRYLAAGSDDWNVTVHELMPGLVVSPDQPVEVEKWGLVKRLYGHKRDVVGVDWSPTDSMLASCSLDGSVRVWDASTWATLCLLQHGSYVKGVAWHPGGNEIAIQMEDKSVTVWCGDSGWKSGTRTRSIPGLWAKDATCFSTRPSWSPCGQYLAAPAGRTRDLAHAAPVMATSDWKARAHLTGHSAAVNAVKFHPSLFRDAAQPEQPAYGVVAVASQDRRLSVWTTEKPPHRLCITKPVFRDDVSDLAWSADGYTLLVSTVDGSVMMIAFDASAMLGEMVVSGPGETEDTRVVAHHDSPPTEMEDATMARTPTSHPAAQESPPGTPHSTNLQAAVSSATTPPVSYPAARDSSSPTVERSKPRRAQQRARATASRQPDRRGRHRQSRKVDVGVESVHPTPVADAGEDGGGGASKVEFSGCWPGEITRSGSMVSVTCSAAGGGGRVVWADKIMGPSAAVAANSFFCAVAMGSGKLHIYILESDVRGPACRKRMPLPDSKSWGDVVSMACSEGCWSLLLLSSLGSIQVWDVHVEPIPCDNINPWLSCLGLRSSGPVDVKLSNTGDPVIATKDGPEYVFHRELRTWAVVRPQPTDGARVSRRSLVLLIAGAASAQEYRDSLVSYARFLITSSDEPRLRTLCEELLEANCIVPDIHPTLGVSRRCVLSDVILPAMAEHQSGFVQELVQEFQELLSDCPLQELLGSDPLS